MTVFVRPAGAGDMTAIATLVADMLVFHGKEAPADPAAFAEALERDGPCGDAHFQCLIADVDGQAAGFAMFSLVYEAAYTASCVFLRDIFVVADHRRSGVGRALMAALAAKAVAEGWPRIDWHADRLDLDARLFYDLLCPDSFKLNRLSYRIEGEEIAALAALADRPAT